MAFGTLLFITRFVTCGQDFSYLCAFELYYCAYFFESGVFGVIWRMVIFNEFHSGWVWSSLVVMLFELSLVLPKKAK